MNAAENQIQKDNIPYTVTARHLLRLVMLLSL